MKLTCPVIQSGLIVGTHCEDLRLGSIEILDTSLVPGEFFRSATGKGGRKECQHNGLLAAVIG